MTRAVWASAFLGAALAACGGGGSASKQITPLQATAQGLLFAVFEVGDGMQQALPALLVPPLAASKGMSFAPDTSKGAPPNSFTFHVPVDGDGDGNAETVLDGSVALNGSLFTFGPGFGGSVTGTMVIDGGARTLSGTIAFRIEDGALELSGSGTISEVATGIEVDFDIDEATPLRVTIANGTTAVANLCDFSAAGPVRIEARGPLGSYAALWTFAFGSAPVAITEASSTDSAGTVPEPDSSFVVGPCANGSIQDWVGTYDFNWFCNPEEEGTSLFVLTVTGPNSIHIDDEGFGYDATAVPGKPHVIRGFFIDNGYREDFTWTLSDDNRTFTQQSVYVFQPPLAGGGFCGGTGTKR